MSVETQSSEQLGTAETVPETDAVGLEGLGQLLAADGLGDDTSGDDASSDAGAESSGSEGQESGKTTPTKFNDLAGALEMDLDALYGLEVQLDGVDEPVTVEQLKDHFRSAADFDLRVLEFEEEATAQRNELAQTKAELQEIMSALPAKAIQPDVLQKLRAKAETRVAEERAQTLAAIPEWKDDNTRAADISDMSEHLQGYGFPVNQLESMVDHRWQRYIRDNMLREKRIRAALDKVRAGKPDKKSGSAAPQRKAASKRAVSPIVPKAGVSRLEATLTSID